MKRHILIIVVSLFLIQISICSAGEIQLNEKITNANFVDVYNKSDDVKDEGIYIVKEIGSSYTKNNKRFITKYVTKIGTEIWTNSDPSSGKIYGVCVVGEAPKNLDDMKPLLMTTMLVERAVGKPSGEAMETGMFALIDATKNGKASYWSNETNRRYIVYFYKPRENMVCYMIEASI